MSTYTNECLDYYSKQSVFTKPGLFSELFKNLPNSIHELCNIVHNVVIHRDTTNFLYGFDLPNNIKQEADTRYVKDILSKIQEKNLSPLITPRQPESRFSGTCRDFAILLCSMLRHKNIPARIRCGFSKYFVPNRFEDHWVCEYWDIKEKRWILTDPEISNLEKDAYNINVNTEDLPRNQFLVAGKAWKICNSGGVDPNLFGVSFINIKGIRFVISNVLRDFAALNKIELLPWDCTKFSDKQSKNISELSKEEIELIDKLSDLTILENNKSFYEIRRLYKKDPRLQVSSNVISYTITGPKIVNLPQPSIK